MNKKKGVMNMPVLNQRDFIKLVEDPYFASFTSKNITSGFQSAGIVPFAPLHVLERCKDWDPLLFGRFVPNFDKTEDSLEELYLFSKKITISRR
jgi:hypothetical protein